ncbi:MAG: type IX secretion system membrane protein PorP/SprF [Flavobacteriales bacterium]|nr:type IX secretion system membrane protein PorP/SprF [Flavobacteriales bacterium]
MKKIIALLFVFIGFQQAFAQQDYQFTQFMYDRLSINPGVAGSVDNSICATLFGRQQWSGFDNAPKTGLLNAHMPVQRWNSGVGASVFYDKLGQETNTVARLHYAYQFQNFLKGKLGAGVSLGMISKKLGNEWIAIDPVGGDDLIPNNKTSGAIFDLGFGLYYYTPQFYLGLSSTHLTEGDIKEVNITAARHYWLQTGYTYAMNSNIDINPNVIVKSDAAATSVDLNLTAMYQKTIWLGVSYRTEDAIAPMIGYQTALQNGKSMLKIGYSYDVNTSLIADYSDGGHEVMVNYCLKLEKPLPPQIFRDPRFL